MKYEGLVYRAHNPRWAFAPTSGEGAARFGGRFNRMGRQALYTSLRIETAWLEAQQGFAFKAQPMTLVAYAVVCDDMLDLSDAAICVVHDVQPDDLSCAWEDLGSCRQPVASWLLAERLIATGIAGVIVPSFAARARPDDRNAVFWRWGEAPPHQVRAIDAHSRLPKDDTAWR